MLPHSGPVVAFMALLSLAGVQKIADPEPTSGALRATGLPGSRTVVFGLGLTELLIGIAGIALRSPLPALAASAFYSGFALFVVNALVRKLPIRSCGCLGATETPPSAVHVVVNVIAAATLLTGVFAPIDVISGLAAMGTGDAVAFVVFTGVSVYLLYGVLTVLPLREGLRRESSVRFVVEHPGPGK